ncbi:MAG: hypothetical protein HY901_09960 [Deltaproteobacteria bacterium]|nr:hypothetical protein [Deltaproteobacteria bacterium]
MLVAPQDAPAGNCFELCEALFGTIPTLNCGERTEPRRSLICSYDRWPTGAPARVSEETPCREECSRAGIEKVEACWPLTTSGGAAAVACQIQVPFH